MDIFIFICELLLLGGIGRLYKLGMTGADDDRSGELESILEGLSFTKGFGDCSLGGSDRLKSEHFCR